MSRSWLLVAMDGAGLGGRAASGWETGVLARLDGSTQGSVPSFGGGVASSFWERVPPPHTWQVSCIHPVANKAPPGQTGLNPRYRAGYAYSKEEGLRRSFV